MRSAAVLRPSSDVCAADEELLDIGLWPWVADIRDEPFSLISSLSSSSSVRRHSPSRHSPSVVPQTSSASSTTREHHLLIRSHRCGPEEYTVAHRLRCFPRQPDVQGDDWANGECVLVHRPWLRGTRGNSLVKPTYIVAPFLWRSFESQPNPGLGSHIPAEIPALSTLSGESILRHLKFYATSPLLSPASPRPVKSP